MTDLQTTTTVPSVGNKPPGKHGVHWPFIILLVVVVVLGVGYLVWNVMQKPADNTSASSSESSTSQSSGSSATTTQTPDGWQTHRNAQAGYQIDYNTKWILAPRAFANCGANCSYVEDLLIKNQENVSFPGGGQPESSVFGVRILAITVPSDLTLRSWIQSGDIPNTDKQARLKRITIMQIAGANREVLPGQDSNWQAEANFVDSGRVYQLTYQSGSAAQFTKDQTTFARMLRSFMLVK